LEDHVKSFEKVDERVVARYNILRCLELDMTQIVTRNIGERPTERRTPIAVKILFNDNNG
jgi:hypothetical protein